MTGPRRRVPSSRHRTRRLTKPSAWSAATPLSTTSRTSVPCTTYSRALRYQINLERAWVGQVRCLLATDENNEAELWADRGLSRFPASADLLAAKGVAVSRTQGPTAGLRFSDRALENGGGSEYVWLARGEVLLAARSDEAARRCFAKAVEVGDEDWHCHYAIGRLLLAAGDPARAGPFQRCRAARSAPAVAVGESGRMRSGHGPDRRRAGRALSRSGIEPQRPAAAPVPARVAARRPAAPPVASAVPPVLRGPGTVHCAGSGVPGPVVARRHRVVQIAP